MFNAPFYHSTFKRLVAGFGKLFADIHVVRRAENGREKERLKVPLTYGPAERYLARLMEDPDLMRGYAIKLPMMSFEIKTIQYDSARKLNTIKKNIQPIPDKLGNVIRQYQGVPYKIGIDLSILCKYIDDANQIVEQILPWFTPAYTITLNTIPEMNYKDDFPVVLQAVNLNDNYEEDWKTRRSVTWTLSFEVAAMFYGPVVEKKLITNAQTDIHSYSAGQNPESPEERTNIPRQSRQITKAENAENYQDDFGYSLEKLPFNDGLVYDPKTDTDVEPKVTFKPKSVKYKSKVGKPKLV